MRFSLCALALSLVLVGAAQAADVLPAPTPAPAVAEPTKAEPAKAKPAKAKPYPLKTCIVSGEALGSMGAPVVQIHDGQEVQFCCKGCRKGFDKDPAKYIADMNKQVAAAKPAASAPVKP